MAPTSIQLQSTTLAFNFRAQRQCQREIYRFLTRTSPARAVGSTCRTDDGIAKVGFGRMPALGHWAWHSAAPVVTWSGGPNCNIRSCVVAGKKPGIRTDLRRLRYAGTLPGPSSIPASCPFNSRGPPGGPVSRSKTNKADV
jgi:hypothetical protein